MLGGAVVARVIPPSSGGCPSFSSLVALVATLVSFVFVSSFCSATLGLDLVIGVVST